MRRPEPYTTRYAQICKTDLAKLVKGCRGHHLMVGHCTRYGCWKFGSTLCGLRLSKLHSGGASVTSVRFVSPSRVSSFALQNLQRSVINPSSSFFSRHIHIRLRRACARSTQLHRSLRDYNRTSESFALGAFAFSTHNGRLHRLCVYIAAAITALR